MENIQRIKCGNGNCYIVSNGENAVLVDTCHTQYREKILNACKPYNMRLLILTHGHIDHAQNAAFISKELNIPIAMHKDDVDLISDNMSQSLKATNIFGKIIIAASLSMFRKEKIPSFTPDVFLSEGDTLEQYGINAVVLSVPGHTNGSIAIDVDEKHLIVGDALMNMFYPTVSMLYHDRDIMLRSAERIGKLGNRVICFGHGKEVNNRAWVR